MRMDPQDEFIQLGFIQDRSAVAPKLWQQLEHPESSTSQQLEGWGWYRWTLGNRWDTREQQLPKPEIQQLGTEQEGEGGGQGARA